MWWYGQEISAIMSGKILSLNYAPVSRKMHPFPQKGGVVLHPLSDYGKTTIEGCDLLRFAPFCKKCDKIRAINLKNISPQNVPKHGV